MMNLANVEPVFQIPAMMFLCTYLFLLRLPSECLPLQVDVGLRGRDAFGISVSESQVEVWLPHRKN
eukprot:1270044-Karenia_brevis.AAC.1